MQKILYPSFVIALALFAGAVIEAPPARAQSMLDMVDLTTDQFTKAEMSRADIEAALAKLPEGETLDLFGKALNKLDLSGMDLRRVSLQAARRWDRTSRTPTSKASTSTPPGR
jgi:uncharacterized protein YjbI with pentapeptide repeats